MIIIDTAFHITFAEYGERPILACIGKCKKAWWLEDFENRDKKLCPMCGSDVHPAIEDVHYKILSKANRNLKYSDFKKIVVMPNHEKIKIKELLKSGVNVTNLSLVKPAFEEKARKKWC